MTPKRYFLITLLTLVGCQTTPQEPAGASSAVPATLVTDAERAAPVIIERAPASRSNVTSQFDGRGTDGATDTIGAADTTEADAKADKAPRILRGTDRVIAPPAEFAALTGAPVSLTFEEAPVAEVVRTVLGDLLKVSYVLHPPIGGAVTLVTRQPVAPDEAVFLLESALQANGLALMRDARGSYHVGRPDALRSIGGSVRQAIPGKPLAPGYGTIIVPLQYIGAAEMATILRPMLPADALARVDNVRNLLVLSGTRTQAEGWLELVSTFDVDLLKGMSVGVFPLKYASIRDVQTALQLVSGGGAPPAAAGGGAGSTAPGAAPAAAAAALGQGNPLFGALRIVPIERLNSILVVTPRAEYLEEARKWIEKLDQPNDNGNERQLFIYPVQNVSAQHLATVLGGIFGGQGASSASASAANSGVSPGLGIYAGDSFGQGTGGGNAFGTSSPFGGSNNALGGNAFGGNSMGGTSGSGGFGASGGTRGFGQQGRGNTQSGNGSQSSTAVDIDGIRVIADQLNNSVLVWSTKAEYGRIESTLRRLDLPLTQVLIEASIVEVTLNDTLEYGLEWAFKDSRANTDYTGRGTLNGASGLPAALGSPLSGFSYALINPAGNVTALLRALSTKTSVKVIASPSLMVLDNHVASINVGTQTPIQAGTTSNLEGTVTTTNIQYKDTGVQLTVTPSVNSGNVVTMQVDQSITDVGAQDEVSKQRAFLQRQLSSKVAVRSGESIVMGGLIQDRSTSSKSGIPFLHTVPVIGNLFGSTANDGNRTELIVIITPRVVRSDVDIRQVSDDLRAKMQGLKAIELREQLRTPRPDTSVPAASSDPNPSTGSLYAPAPTAVPVPALPPISPALK